jgi:hypothetical protein
VLRLGWRASEKRDTIWIGDPALENVPESAREDWQKDGDAVHLRPYATAGQPEGISFRSLTFTEAQYIKGMYDSATPGPSFELVVSFCFRLAVRFKDAAESYTVESTGAGGLRTIERVAGFAVLAEGFCNNLRFEYPGMVEFYGALIWTASMPTEPEKKASSPPLTTTPLSAVASSTGATAAAGEAVAEAA